jgi:hypothetical protein
LTFGPIASQGWVLHSIHSYVRAWVRRCCGGLTLVENMQTLGHLFESLKIMMEIVANKDAKLGVPTTLDMPIQAMFAEAEGWVRKWLQDRTAREEKATGMAQLGVPGLVMVAQLTSSGMDSLPSVKIADAPSRKVSVPFTF